MSKQKMPESEIRWISCKDDMPDTSTDILIYINGSDDVFAATTFSNQLGHCFHECGTYILKRDDFFAYLPKVRCEQ